MLRQLPIALAFGLSSALLYAAALSGSFVGIALAYLAMIPLFAVGLMYGVQTLSVASACAAVGIMIFGGVLPGLLYGISHALPCLLLVSFALRNRTWNDGQVYWYPPGRLMQGLALWCAGAIAALALVLSAVSDGFRNSIVAFLQAMTEAFRGAEQGAPAMDAGAIEGMALLLPGLVAWSWMIMTTLNGLLAQTIVRRAGRNLRPSPRLKDVVIGQRWAIAFGAFALAGALLPGDLGLSAINIAIVLAYPLFFQGLSVIHSLFAYWGVGAVGVGLFYGLMVLLSWIALAVIALGLAEPLLRLRTRFTGTRNT